MNVATFLADVEKIKTRMISGTTAITESHQQKSGPIANIKNLEKVKVWTADGSKSAKSYLTGIISQAKNARGTMKTLSVEIEGLDKRGKAAGPGWKEQAAKAVDEAKKPYKEAELASKKFDADEEKCKKICKDHNITV